MKIPHTNILVINTVNKYEDTSIVYYNDLASASGVIINVIKRNFYHLSIAVLCNNQNVVLIFISWLRNHSNGLYPRYEEVIDSQYSEDHYCGFIHFIIC